MGREVSRSEHSLPGRVTIARPLDPHFELPDSLREKQVRIIEKIKSLKQSSQQEMNVHNDHLMFCEANAEVETVTETDMNDD